MTKIKRNKRLSVIVLVWLMLFLTAACAKSPDGTGEKDAAAESRTIFAMDTYMTLQIYGKQAKEAAEAVTAEIGRLERLLSTGNDASEVSFINREKTGILSKDTRELLQSSLAIYEDTHGAFDITVYPLMCAWNFTGEVPRVPKQEEIAELLPLVNASELTYEPQTGKLTLSGQQMIDFGGIAKGYTGKRLKEILMEYGISSAMLNLGGNVQLVGAKPDGSNWKIAVQSPDKTGYLGVAALSDCAVVTSGGYERYFTEQGVTYHHILDPKTGYPAQSGLSSVTVICADGTVADGLSTALFVMGTERAAAFWREHREEFECVLYTDTDELLVTAGLKDCFSSERSIQIIE